MKLQIVIISFAALALCVVAQLDLEPCTGDQDPEIDLCEDVGATTAAAGAEDPDTTTPAATGGTETTTEKCDGTGNGGQKTKLVVVRRIKVTRKPGKQTRKVYRNNKQGLFGKKF